MFEGFFLRFGKEMLRTLYLLFGGECYCFFSIEVSRALDIFLRREPSYRFYSWLVTSFYYFYYYSFRSLINPIWN